MEQAGSLERGFDGDEGSSLALTGLVERINAACRPADEWPAKVGSGVYAAVDYLVAEPKMARELLANPAYSSFGEPFRHFVHTVSQLLDETVPLQARPRPDTPSGVIAGAGLVVGEHVRADRSDRLLAIRPDLHLLVLLPFLNFDVAKGWVVALQKTIPP